jgi:hypothetical protein
VIDWVKAVRANELRKHAGDPGPVLARRLSNSEYNYTIRDLTGVDLKPTREFPVDPANQSGFDNTGESLTMSPALFNKYLLATREVTDHMALTPDGFIFAPGPVLAETDRDQFAIKRIVDFYHSQPTDYADYFEAAWRYKHRVALGNPTATLASAARAKRVSPKYLPLVWRILGEPVARRKREPLRLVRSRSCKPCGRRCLRRHPRSSVPVRRKAFVRATLRCASSWSASARTRRCNSQRRW